MYQPDPFKNSILTASRNPNTSVDSLSTSIKVMSSEMSPSPIRNSAYKDENVKSNNITTSSLEFVNDDYLLKIINEHQSNNNDHTYCLNESLHSLLGYEEIIEFFSNWNTFKRIE